MTPAATYDFDHLPEGRTLNHSQGTTPAGMAYRARLNRAAKRIAFQEIERQRRAANREPLMLDEAIFELTFFVPTRGRRGVENLIAAAKPYMDAVCPVEIDGEVRDGDVVSDDWPAVKRIDARMVYRKDNPGFRISVIPVVDPQPSLM